MNTTHQIPIRVYNDYDVFEFEYTSPEETLYNMICTLCIVSQSKYMFFLIPTELTRREFWSLSTEFSNNGAEVYWPTVITVEQFVYYLAKDLMPHKNVRVAIYNTLSVLKQLKSLPQSDYDLAISYLNQHLEAYSHCPLHKVSV